MKLDKKMYLLLIGLCLFSTYAAIKLQSSVSSNTKHKNKQEDTGEKVRRSKEVY